MDNFENLNLSLSDTNETFYVMGEILGYYVIPATALIGTVLRIVYGILLYKLNLTHLTKYKMLLYKIFSLVIFNLIYIGFKNNSCNICPNIVYNTYTLQFIRLYFSNHLLITIGVQVFSFELLIAYDRFCILKKMQSAVNIDKIKYVYLLSLVFGTIMLAPYYLAYEIEYSRSLDLYFITKTWIGNSKFFFWYKLTNLIMNQSIVIFGLILLNILNIIQYKRFIKNKSHVLTEMRKLKAEAVFTKMIIIGTSLFIFATAYYSTTLLIININLINGIQYNSFANFNIMFSFEIILVSFILDLFIFSTIDRNVKQKVKSFFKIKEKNTKQINLSVNSI